MRILITGASGFLGDTLIKRLQGNTITAVARNEGKLVALKQKYPDIKILCGDIADACFVKRIVKGQDKLYHLAAQKHIDIAEQQPRSCMYTNLVGTAHLVDHFTGDRFVFISTDKAAQVNGVYGATKYLAEKVIEEASKYSDVEYRIIRYGNVLYSTGSVLVKWKKLLQEGKDIVITDPTATRFFWTVDQAIDQIFDCEASGTSAIYIPEMKAMSIGNLATAMMQKYGDSKIIQIGLQKGENLHETMDGKVFSNQVPQYTVEEIVKII